MIVNHYGVEFGYELIAVIPFAYWNYVNNNLEKTVSHKDTKCLYYFSPNHEESLGRRHSKHVRTCMNEGDIPNIYIHVPYIDESRWLPPPYKEWYYTKEHNFDIVVSNKYNVEVNGYPENFYSPEELDQMFDLLKDYNVLYNHMTSSMGHEDKVKSLELGEWDVVKAHSHVTTIQDVMKETGYNYNEAQLRTFSNARLFITVQGGASVLASYFGGVNIILAKVGHELKCEAFDNWYHKFGGSKIIHHGHFANIMDEIQRHI